MDKDNYNIDNILSEVKKRKMNAAESKPEEKTEPTAKGSTEKLEEKPAEPAKAQAEPVAQEPAPEKEAAVEAEEPLENAVEAVEEEPNEMPSIEDAEEEPISDEEYVELPQDNGKKTKKTDTRERVRKVAIAALSIILALVIATCGYGYFGIYKPFQKGYQGITDENGETTTHIRTTDELVESFSPITETEASEIASLEDMIKQWYKNGEPCSSSHVYNVMLIGEDTRGTDVVDEGSRADAVIVASVNVDTKEITLTSILRDSWAYYETTDGDESTGHFNKINSAMSVGNVGTYIKAFENLFKIKIDNYVIINFDAFKSVVDILGGVTIDVSAAEAREINNHPKRYGNVTIEGTGELNLTGEQALAYCRIRKLDSDNMRANRQKECLTKIFEGVKSTNKTKLLKIATKILPYVKTDMSIGAITNRAEDAFSQGWTSYDVRTTTIPQYRINEKGASGTFPWAGKQWIWKVDYPQDAYNIQTVLYGKSSITLAHTRVDHVNCVPQGFRSEGAPAVSATFVNQNYGEVSTTEIKKDDEE